MPRGQYPERSKFAQESGSSLRISALNGVLNRVLNGVIKCLLSLGHPCMKATCKPGLRPLSEISHLSISWYPPACLTVNYSVLSDSLPSEEDLQESHSLSYVHLPGWCPVQPSSAQSEKEGTRAAWHPGAQRSPFPLSTNGAGFWWFYFSKDVESLKSWDPHVRFTKPVVITSLCSVGQTFWDLVNPALTGVVGGKSDISLFSINCSWSNN